MFLQRRKSFRMPIPATGWKPGGICGSSKRIGNSPHRGSHCAATDRNSSAKQEDLSLEFGLDAHFLPQPELPGSLRMIQSNIQSLLKLVHDLDDALPVETRQLWSESGENFSEKLHQALAGQQK